MAKSFMEMMDKEYGDDLEFILSKDNEVKEVIPTGILSLDVSTGVGGIPLGRFTEIYGPESCGKTTLALTVAKEAIKLGKRVLFVDMENSIDVEYAKAIIGYEFSPEDLLIAQPETGEQAISIIELGIASEEFGLIILDSVASLAPEKEQKDNIADSNYALVPRLMARFFRRQVYKVRTGNVAVLFTNQVRAKIGAYIPTIEPPGGNAMKHYCSMRILLTKGKDIKDDDKESIGTSTKFVIKKNKVGKPLRSFNVAITYGKGYDVNQDILQFASFLGIVQRRGAYYKFEDTTLGAGVVNSVAFLTETDEGKLILDKIKEMSYNIVNSTNLGMEEDTDE